MSIFSSRVVATAMCVFVGSTLVASDEIAGVEDVLARIKEREELIETLAFAIEEGFVPGSQQKEFFEFRIKSAKAIAKLMKEKLEAPKKPSSFAKVLTRYRYTRSPKGIRIEFDEQETNGIKNPKTASIYVYDGETWRSLREDSGVIYREEELATLRPSVTVGLALPTLERSKFKAPWRSLHTSLQFVLENHEMFLVDYTAGDGSAKKASVLGDETARIVSLRFRLPLADKVRADAGGYLRVDLDLDRSLGYAPTRMVSREFFIETGSQKRLPIPDSVIKTTSWSYFDRHDGVFLPQRYVQTTTKPAPRPKAGHIEAFTNGNPNYRDFDYSYFEVMKEEAVIKNTVVNGSVDAKEFELEFPEGTGVFDARTGDTYYIGGINPEIKKGLEARRLASGTPESRVRPWLLVANAIVVFMLVLVILARKKLRST